MCSLIIIITTCMVYANAYFVHPISRMLGISVSMWYVQVHNFCVKYMYSWYVCIQCSNNYADSGHSCVPNVYIAKSHINNSNHWIYWKNEDYTCICKRYNKGSVLCFVFSQISLVVLLSLHQRGTGT